NGVPSATVLPDVVSPTVLPSQPPASSTQPDPPKVRPFVPMWVNVPGLGSHAVQALPRMSVGDNGFTLPDPLDANPEVYAWDRDGAMPGSSQGAANLVAHTY